MWTKVGVAFENRRHFIEGFSRESVEIRIFVYQKIVCRIEKIKLIVIPLPLFSRK